MTVGSLTSLPRPIWVWPGLFAFVLSLLSACGRDGQSLEQRLETATEQLRAGNLHATMVTLKAAAQAYPDSAEARRQLGAVYLEQGDGLSAEKELAKAISLAPKTAGDELMLVEALVLAGDADAALERVDQPSGDRATTELTALRGAAELAKGRREPARELFDAALKSAPDNPVALLGSAQLAFLKGEFPAAREILERYLMQKPLKFDAWLLDGESKYRMGDYAAARTSFDKAQQLNPLALTPRFGRIKTYLDEQELVNTEREIADAEKLAGDNIALKYFRGVLHYHKREVGPAMDAFRAVLAKSPAHTSSQYLLGILLYRTGKLEQAEDLISLVHKAAPDFLPARKLLASIQIRRRKAASALETLGEGTQTPEEEVDLDLLVLRANALLGSGDFAGGIEALKKASAIAPDNEKLKNSLVMAQVGLGRADDAVDMLEHEVETDPLAKESQRLLLYAHLAQKQYDAAIKAAKAALAVDANDSALYNSLGMAYFGKGDLARSRAAFVKALELSPDVRSVRRNLVRLDLAEDNFSGARKTVEKLLAEAPEDPLSLELAGRVAVARNDLAKATEYFEQTRKLDPRNVSALLFLSRFYFERSEYRKAADASAEAVRLAPSNIDVLLALGHSLRAIGDTSDAANVAKVAVNLFPKAASSHYLAGIVKLDQGQPGEAKKELMQARELEPDSSEAISALALAALADGDFGSATQYIEGFAKYDSEGPQLHLLKGELAAAQSNYAAAADEFGKAWSGNPSAATAAKLNYSLWRAGNAERAIAGLRAATKDFPDDLMLKSTLAQVLEREGDVAGAIAAYEAVIEKKRDSIVALNNLANLKSGEDPAGALALAERASQLAPRDPNIADTHGWILVAAGQLEEGIGYLEQAAANAPQDGEIRYHLAVALARTREPKRAREELEAALKLDSLRSKDNARALLESLAR